MSIIEQALHKLEGTHHSPGGYDAIDEFMAPVPHKMSPFRRSGRLYAVFFLILTAVAYFVIFQGEKREHTIGYDTEDVANIGKINFLDEEIL